MREKKSVQWIQNQVNASKTSERASDTNEWKLVDYPIHAHTSIDVHGKYNTSDFVARNKISMGFLLCFSAFLRQCFCVDGERKKGV